MAGTIDTKAKPLPSVRTEPKPTVAPVAVAAPVAEAKAPSTEGFEAPKKKIVNFTGRHKAVVPPKQKTDFDSAVALARNANLAPATKYKTVNAGPDALVTGETAAMKGAAPGPRDPASDFAAKPDLSKVPDAQAGALKKKGYTDATAGRAIEVLATKPKPISGKDMMNAIASATIDRDQGASSTEFNDLKNFYKANEKNLSPEAKAQFAIYESAVDEAKKTKTPGISPAKHAEMVGEMERLEGMNAIKREFGINVQDGYKTVIHPNGPDTKELTAKWTSEQLALAHESFAQMPKADQAKLKGLDLIRQPVAPASLQTEHKGVIAGVYSPNTQTTNGKRDQPGSITMFDSAFRKQKTPEQARQTAIHVITHEAGHAVEGRAGDDAQVAWGVANDKRSQVVDKLESASKDAVAANGAYVVAWKPLKQGTSNPALTKFQAAEMKVDAAQNEMRGAKDKKELDAAKKHLATAMTARDASVKGLKGDTLGDANALVAASNEHSKAIVALGDAKLELAAADKELTGKRQAWEGVATVDFVEVNKVTTGIPKRSKEQAAFERATSGKDAVSEYGAEKKSEGYAEAYSLYQRDPAYLKQHHKQAYDFFRANHRSAKDK